MSESSEPNPEKLSLDAVSSERIADDRAAPPANHTADSGRWQQPRIGRAILWVLLLLAAQLAVGIVVGVFIMMLGQPEVNSVSFTLVGSAVTAVLALVVSKRLFRNRIGNNLVAFSAARMGDQIQLPGITTAIADEVLHTPWYVILCAVLSSVAILRLLHQIRIRESLVSGDGSYSSPAVESAAPIADGPPQLAGSEFRLALIAVTCLVVLVGSIVWSAI
jgi:hypothetical protein